MNTVICPHCKKEVEISQALKHELTEKERTKLQVEFKKELEAAKILAVSNSEKRIKEQFELELRTMREDAKEKDNRIKELIEQLTELNKELRLSKKEKEEAKLEMQKALAAEEEKIRLDAKHKAEEASHLKIKENEKKLQDALLMNEELKRKLEQGSQQLQGEVLELDLEGQLERNFPTDEILPVPKGIEGADIRQVVRNKFGQTAGVILWETKRAKDWKKDWPIKLREEKRKINAQVAIIVSDVMPAGIDTFGWHGNIWVTTYKYALPLCEVVRIGLFELAVAKSTTAHKDEKLEALFTYLANDSFRNRFESQVESLITLRDDLEAEQRSTIRIWKKREMQLKRLMTNTASIYGELQGIMGDSLPSIQSLDSGNLTEEPNQQNLLEE